MTTKYILRIAIAAAAFLIGQVAFTGMQNVCAGVRYVMTHFESKEYEFNAAVTPPAEPLSITYSETPPPDSGLAINVSGEYYLMDEALIKGFPDLNYFEIESTDFDGSPVAPRGSLHTKREHKFISISLSGDRVAFETEAIRGISYRFSGTIGLETADPTSDRVLRGNFMKLENGLTVGWMYATFYPGGDC